MLTTIDPSDLKPDTWVCLSEGWAKTLQMPQRFFATAEQVQIIGKEMLNVKLFVDLSKKPPKKAKPEPKKVAEPITKGGLEIKRKLVPPPTKRKKGDGPKKEPIIQVANPIHSLLEQSAVLSKELFGKTDLRSMKSMEEIVATIADTLISSKDTGQILTSMTGLDWVTHEHTLRVPPIAILLAIKHHKDTRKAPPDIPRLLKSSTHHDIGKTEIPESILNAPRKLTDKEFTEIKTHTTRGLRILMEGDYSIESQEVALQHHEKFGGGGYPKRLQGEKISKTARLVAIADVFDALTSKRPYKNVIEPLEALQIMREDANHFDPTMLRSFISLFG